MIDRTGTPLVEMRDISISFGGIQAVDKVSVDLFPGERFRSLLVALDEQADRGDDLDGQGDRAAALERQDVDRALAPDVDSGDDTTVEQLELGLPESGGECRDYQEHRMK